MRGAGPCAVLVPLAIALAAALPAAAADGADPPVEPAAEEAPDPESDEAGRPGALDKVQRALSRTVVGTARWFDRVFGDPRAFEEANRTYGVLQLGGLWDEDQGWEAIGRLRARWHLPRMERRLAVVVGRLRDERAAPEEEHTERVPAALEDDEQQWQVGVDYTRKRTVRKRVSFSVGARLRTPVETYAKVRFRYRAVFGERTALALRLTPYWQDGDRRFGVGGNVDLDRRLSPDLLLRWTVTGYDDRRTRKVRYWAGVTLFQAIGERNAVSYRAGVRGETGAEVRDEEYGVFCAYRRRLSREWLYVSSGAGASWRRPTLDAPRHPALLAELSLELHLGRP